MLCFCSLNEKCQVRTRCKLLCLNTCSPAGGAIWEGYGTFEEAELCWNKWATGSGPQGFIQDLRSHFLFTLCFRPAVISSLKMDSNILELKNKIHL